MRMLLLNSVLRDLKHRTIVMVKHRLRKIKVLRDV